MDSIKSFKGYGKVDEIEQQAFKQKTRRRYIIIAVSTIILAAVIIGAVCGIAIHRRNDSSSSSDNSSPASGVTPAASLTALCSATQYPTSCFSSLGVYNTTDPNLIFKYSLHVAAKELGSLAKLPAELAAKTNSTAEKEALKVCGEVLDDAAGRLNDTAAEMESGKDGKPLSPSMIHDFEAWLSASLTDMETCLDGLDDLSSTLYPVFRDRMKQSTELASNSLAIVTKVLKVLVNFDVPVHRRLMAIDGEGFPEWLGVADRRLLQGNSNSSEMSKTITVAKDGTADFMTVQEAVDRVPKKSTTRFTINIKQGTYVENVVLDKNKWNIAMVGEGRTKTIISGSKNFIDGTPTFATATLGMDFSHSLSVFISVLLVPGLIFD